MKLRLHPDVVVQCAQEASFLDDGVLCTRDEFVQFCDLLIEQMSVLARAWALRDPPVSAEI